MIALHREGAKRPWIIAHRGASGNAPENTMAAFGLALERGADMVETDVQLTADGALVAIHDATLERTTNGGGFVKDCTLEQIRSLDAGSWFAPEYAGERVPTLDELLEWASSRIPVCLEIKNGPIYYPEIEARVVETLRRHDMIDRAIVISFDHLAVLRTKQLCSELVCGVLFACKPVDPAALAASARAEIVLPHWSNLTPEIVEQIHERELAVSCWTVDGEQEMRWVTPLGIDGIATNHPSRLASLLDVKIEGQRSATPSSDR